MVFILYSLIIINFYLLMEHSKLHEAKSKMNSELDESRKNSDDSNLDYIPDIESNREKEVDPEGELKNIF